jgi:hypothetical protein
MDKNETAELIKALQKGQVTVTFQKVNSDEIRVMPCTLNPTVLEANGVKPAIDNIGSESDNLPAWSLDKNAWRSFRKDTVISWEVLGE